MATNEGKTVLVTGSTSGIGKEVALSLAGKGALVILGARNLSLAEHTKAEIINRVPEARVVVPDVPLDLASNASIKQFVDKVFGETERPLHILINNAGMNLKDDEAFYTDDKIGGLAQTNFLGPYYLTRLLEARLIKAKGRIVNVASVTHRLVQIPDAKAFLTDWSKGRYWNTKLSNVYFAYECQRRLGPLGVQSCAVDPGGVRTRINYSFSTKVSFGAKALKKMLHTFFAPPKHGAAVVVHAAMSPWEAQRFVGGRGAAAEPTEDFRFYARGLYASPVVYKFTPATTAEGGKKRGMIGTALRGLPWATACLWDYPVRFLSAGALASTIYVVPSSPASYDKEVAKALWEEAASALKIPLEVQV